MYTPPIESAPSTPDINAFRSAQLRATRQQRRGKMFSRTMLAILLIGGLVAAALVFGRRYLFPTEWDQSLTPIVDDIQNERGVEFDHTVGLVKQPSADYALTTGRLVVDDGWLAQVPVWRALGLTTGEPTADGIAPALAASRLAVYDPDADRIYMSADASPAAAAADLRFALEQAYAAQHGAAESVTPDDESTAGFLGVSPPQQIIDAAIDTYIAERETASFRPRPTPRPVRWRRRRPGRRRRSRSRSSTSWRRSTISARRCCRRPVSTRRRRCSACRTRRMSAPRSTTAPARPQVVRSRSGTVRWRRPSRSASTTGRWYGAHA